MLAGGSDREPAKQRYTMKKIYIVGAGGAAKEICHLIMEINAAAPSYEIQGFVDVIDKEKTMTVGRLSFPVYPEKKFLKSCSENVCIVFGVGDAANLKKASEKFSANKSFEFPNLIYPGVKLHDSVRMGMGNIISAACVFTVDISFGSFNNINRGVHLGHDCTIGSWNVINPCAVISGGVVMMDENLIGTCAAVLQYLKIGSRNIIGAGAVVTKNVANNCCMVGVPAKSKK